MGRSRIQILLATYNGARFIKQQLDSIGCQSENNLSLLISDDGSVDDTLNIIESKVKDLHSVRMHQIILGPRKGFQVNFLNLLRSADLDCEYFAFCDQDDVWRNNKLERAILRLQESAKRGVPALYCSASILIDESGGQIGYSGTQKKVPSFENSLVQNIAPGCTFVFNRAALFYLQRMKVLKYIAHDWMVYQIMAAIGGVIVYDQYPTIYYRCHGNNTIGVPVGFSSRLAYAFRGWRGGGTSLMTSEASSVLNDLYYDDMSERNRYILNNFMKFKASKNILFRMYYLYKSGVRKNRFIGNVNILMGACLGKV